MQAAANPNVLQDEVEKFSKLSGSWWDPKGPCKPLHDLNPARLQFVQNHCQLLGARVLDVGCGGGILSEALARSKANVTGIDAASMMIEVAMHHATSQSLEIDYHVSTAEDWATTHAQQYDVITCMELLEHVPSPQSVLDACASMLKPNGKLFLSTLNRTVASFLKAIIGAEYICGLLPKGTHHYQEFIKPSELDAGLRSAGLSWLDLKGLDYNPWLHRAKIVDNVDVNYLVAAVKS